MARVRLGIGVLLLCLAGCREESPATWALSQAESEPKPVALHLGKDAAEGFRGDVHSLLRSDATLEVAAHWSSVPRGRAYELKYFPDRYYDEFRKLTVFQPQHQYSARDFSALLPQEFGSVGQVWTLDAEKVARFLGQFRPNPSLLLKADGRRAGPNGAFGVLQGLSDSHAEIALRVHAEFRPAPGIFYTPACFLGSLIVNRESRAVEYFQLGLPAERTLNVTLTVVLPTEALIDIVHVDRMELVGGDETLADRLVWNERLEPAAARQILVRQFYPFTEIAWVPPAEALARAQQENKPVFAVVLWGDLDDQSC